jgi:hypothetical protein
MAKIITKGTGLNPAAELEEWRRILATRGKRLRKSRFKIIEGYVHYSGTVDDLTLCWNQGLLVARKKSTLKGERFQKEKCFEGSRRSADRFAEGNRLASKLYALVDKEKKVYSLFCFLKKKAILLIKEGKSITDAEGFLMDYLKNFGLIKSDVRTCLPACSGRTGQRNVRQERTANSEKRRFKVEMAETEILQDVPFGTVCP